MPRSLVARLAAASLLLLAVTSAASAAPRPSVDRFNEDRAFAFLERQVALGARPAGSAASKKLAAILRSSVPNGRYQPVPGDLRNVVGHVTGRNPRRTVVVGAHYDTKDLPGFVGANDGASGTALVRELARTIRPRELRPTVVFVFFDGEESPADAPDGDFEKHGLRGSKVAARSFRKAEAMVLVDMIADKDLVIPRETLSNRRLWTNMRGSAARVGVAQIFPAREHGAILDDHVPFLRAGVPAIDLIDFDFPCWHRTCDDLTAVSQESLDAVGETVLELLRSF